ncbi:MAG: cation:proton antiporter [Gemmatimonadaceae bacterium]
MSAGLILILVVALAYLATHVAFDWIARRFLIVSGAEYLLLGILLGPQVAGVLSGTTIDAFAPFTTLALGWIGAIVGTQFYIPELVRIKGLTYRLAFAEAIITLLVVSLLEMVAVAWLFDIPFSESAIPAFALGAIATVAAPSGIEVVARRLGQRGPVVRQLEVTTAVDALVAITTFGILMCIQHPSPEGLARALTTTEWVAVTIGIGLVGGALFHLFLGPEKETDRLWVALAGAIILTAGAAAYLGLSPLLPAMIVGATLVNTSTNRQEIENTLIAAERPFYFVLLIFAGATWAPSLRQWIAPVLLFLAARAAGKIGGARLATRMNDALPVFGRDWGRALLGQGGLAVALGLDYLQHDRLILSNVVFTAAIASVLLTDLSAAHLVRSVVAPFMTRRVGDHHPEPARPDRAPSPPAAAQREQSGTDETSGERRAIVAAAELSDAIAPPDSEPGAKRHAGRSSSGEGTS